VLAAASLPLLALQAWLGKVTVERELPAEVVAVHLATALILLSMLSLIAVFALQGPRRSLIDTAERRSFTKVTLVAAVVTAGVVLIGSYVVGTNAGYACTSWPGCAEAQVPFIDGGRLQHIHWLHRFTVVIGLLAVAAVAIRTYLMQEAGETLRRGVAALVGLYLLQILVGALNIWSEFADAALVAHLAIGGAIWALLVVLAIAGRYRAGIEQPSGAGASARGGAAPEPGGAHA
jgi:heme A synthase